MLNKGVGNPPKSKPYIDLIKINKVLIQNYFFFLDWLQPKSILLFNPSLGGNVRMNTIIFAYTSNSGYMIYFDIEAII